MSYYIKVLVFVSLLFFPGISQATIVLPDGLIPGDKYRIAFVTSSIRDAESSIIEEYNSFVTSAALSNPELVALGTTWTAIASTSSRAARDNTDSNPNVSTGDPIFLVDGITKIADSNMDLWDGSLDSPLSLDEMGVAVSSAGVWTGSSVDGTGMPDAMMGLPNPQFGLSNSSTATWISAGDGDSGSFGRIYAISGPLTAVPEPCAFFCVGLVGFGLIGWKKLNPSETKKV